MMILQSCVDAKPTEEDFKSCRESYSKQKEGVSLGQSFDEGIQLHYANFRIDSVSYGCLVLLIFNCPLFVYGLLLSFLQNEIWLMRMCMIARCCLCCVGIFLVNKVFLAKVHPDNKNRRAFCNYVRVVTSLSNFLIVSFSLVNGVEYAWRSSRGSCLDDQDNTRYGYLSNLGCNPSYEAGSTPTDSLIMLLFGNICLVAALRCHSYWASCLSYIIAAICTAIAAAVCRSPITSLPAMFFATYSIVIYNGMEMNSLLMFKAFLSFESTNRVKTAEMKHFIGNVAHDIKTPLHGFSMCMDQLLLVSLKHMAAGEERDTMIDTLQMCKTSCCFMNVAINRTADYSKSFTSENALVGELESVSVSDAVQWAVACLESTLHGVKSIKVNPLPKEVCDVVVTDKHWLMENILCYLSNAVKYTPSGVVSVSVSVQETSNEQRIVDQLPRPSAQTKKKCSSPFVQVHPVETACSSSGTGGVRGKQLRITVVDEGIGVKEGCESTLFCLPLQQTMRSVGGTGLGLYSLSKRVEALGGQCGYESRADGHRGSQFWFSIPYVPDEDYVSEKSKSFEDLFEHTTTRSCWTDCLDRDSKRAALPRLNSSRSTQIALVVEDSAVVAKTTARMLKNSGYDVDLAENGAIGLAMMRQTSYSIVIMDLQMPVMDGLEATQRIRAIEEEEEALNSSSKRKQYIIGTSANGADDVEQAALNSGMDVFIPKPFSVSDLIKSTFVARASDDSIV